MLVLHMAAAQAGEGDVLALARLWSEARATHPALADGAIDWDRALVAALPQLQGKDGEASLLDVARTLMAPLHDPALRIGLPSQEFVRWPADGAVLEWLPGDTALLHLHPGMRLDTAPFVLPARARRVILDLRPIAEVPSMPSPPVMLHAVLAQLIGQPLLLPAGRYRFSTGPRPQDPQDWEGIVPGFMQMETQRLYPSAGARALTHGGDRERHAARARRHAGVAACGARAHRGRGGGLAQPRRPAANAVAGCRPAGGVFRGPAGLARRQRGALACRPDLDRGPGHRPRAARR